MDQIDSGTSLMVSLGSQFPDFGQVEIETGDSGIRQTVAIRIADLIASPNPTGAGIDVNHLEYLFAIAATGTGKARIRIDNIRLTCAVNEIAKSWQPPPACSIGPVLETAAITASSEIFVDRITRWTAGDCCGGATVKVVDDDLEPERGKVVEFSYQTDATVTHFQSAAPMDFSALSGGILEFGFAHHQQSGKADTVTGALFTTRAMKRAEDFADIIAPDTGTAVADHELGYHHGSTADLKHRFRGNQRCANMLLERRSGWRLA